jgi:AraC-like DNA-binding protein
MFALAELRSLIARHAESPALQRALPSVTLSTKNSTTDPIQYVVESTFGLVAQGAKRVVLGNTVFDYGSGQYLVVSVDLPVTAHIIEASAQAPLLGFGLTLEPAVIATLLLDSNAPADAGGNLAGIAVSDATDDLVEAVIRLLRLMDRPEDIPILGAAIEREIVWRLMNGAQGGMVRQLGLADSRMMQIGRAVMWIREHFAEAFQIEDLAKLAGMSETSFHRHFRTVTALTPIQYQKQIRLQEARNLLMNNSNDIASAGFMVGYESPSQFSREYRRFFGAPPRRDAALAATGQRR